MGIFCDPWRMLLASTDQPSLAERRTLSDFTPLSMAEARRLTDEAFAVAEDLDARLLVLYRGLAWKALGYRNWGDYVEEEFTRANGRKIKKSQAYAIIAFAAQKQEIAARNSDSEI